MHFAILTFFTYRTRCGVIASMSFRPDYSSEEEIEVREQNEEDDFSSLSFGALSSAQKKLEKAKPRDLPNSSESESETESEEERPRKHEKKSRRNKHAPAESSAKKPVSRIREIPGLEKKNQSSLYSDVRFDAAYGKADFDRIRKDYAFLDDYRREEIKQLQAVLGDKKQRSKLSEREVDDIKMKIQSLQSRLDALKNRDLSNKIIKDHKKQQIEKVKSGEQTNPYFLKKSEQRKMMQKAKFDTLKKSQRDKVMERKRKRRLGKEFRELEFR